MHQNYTAVRDYFASHPELKFAPTLYDFSEIDSIAMQAISTNLLVYRKSLNYSQGGMARVLDASLSQYKKCEAGVESMRVDMAQKWALRTNLSFYHLLEGSIYDQCFMTSNYDKKISFIWFLANALSDEFFFKLVNIIHLFIKNSHFKQLFKASGITREKMNRAVKEIDSDMYIAIAYGLRATRDHFGCTQEQIAELMGISLPTYQQYEKPTMKPRFNIINTARFGISTGIPPVALLQGTQYGKLRYMQDERWKLMREVTDGIDPNLLVELKYLVNGFFASARNIPQALMVDL